MLRDDALDHENRPVKYGLTPADRQRLVERYFEAKAHEQRLADLHFARALAFAQELKRRAGG